MSSFADSNTQWLRSNNFQGLGQGAQGFLSLRRSMAYIFLQASTGEIKLSLGPLCYLKCC